MDIRAALEEDHSKAQAQMIADYIATDAAYFKEFMRIFFEGPYRITQRAAWPMRLCACKHPHLIEPYLPQMLDKLKKGDIHSAVKRNIYRLMEDISLPEELWGEIMTLCYEALNDPKEAIAVRAFSMSVLCRIVEYVPELKRELQLVIEAHLPYGSKGYTSRAKKVLKKLEKIGSTV